MTDIFLISGCSGGGKSTLLIELARRGYRVIDEPGRRIVSAALNGAAEPLPWKAPGQFARRALDLASSDLQAAAALTGPVFFDRGVVDAAIALEHSEGLPARETLGPILHYSNPVFLTPPWPEIFRNDPERRHGFDAALEEYERLRIGLPNLGYTVRILPKSDVSDRADFILSVVA